MSRSNKATISDEAMGAAFKQGFAEGLASIGTEVIYQITATLDGTMFRRTTFKDLGTALVEAQEMLRHGVGMVVSIAVYPESTPQMTTPKAVAEVEPDVEDAVVVEDSSGE